MYSYGPKPSFYMYVIMYVKVLYLIVFVFSIPNTMNTYNKMVITTSSHSVAVLKFCFYFLVQSLMMASWKLKCVHVAVFYTTKTHVVFDGYTSWFCWL